MKKAISTNAVVFAQANDNTKAVVATRNDQTVYLAYALKKANEPIYEALGGKRVEGVKEFRVEFATVKNAKAFIAQGICEVNADDYAKARKTEPKVKAEPKAKKVAPAPAKGKKDDGLVTVALPDGTKAQVKKSDLAPTEAKKTEPKKAKGDAKPTPAPTKKATPKKAEKVATPKKAKGNAELTDAQKKALDIAKTSILNRAAAAYSVANGGTAQVTFKSLGKTEKDLAKYIPAAKAGMMKSKKWAYAVKAGITEDMLG